jgi:hypothetical protein
MTLSLAWTPTTLHEILPRPLAPDPSLPTLKLRKTQPDLLWQGARARLVWSAPLLERGRKFISPAALKIQQEAIGAYEAEPGEFEPIREAASLILARGMLGNDDLKLEETVCMRWVERVGLGGLLGALIEGSHLKIQLNHPRLHRREGGCLYLRLGVDPVEELGEEAWCSAVEPELTAGWLLLRRLLCRASEEQYFRLKDQAEKARTAASPHLLKLQLGLALAFPDEADWAFEAEQQRRANKFPSSSASLLACGKPEQQLEIFQAQPYDPAFDPYLPSFVHDVGIKAWPALSASLPLLSPASRKARAHTLAVFKGKETEAFWRELVSDPAVKPVAKACLGMKKKKAEQKQAP